MESKHAALLAVLGLGGVAAGYYFWTRRTSTPAPMTLTAMPRPPLPPLPSLPALPPAPPAPSLPPLPSPLPSIGPKNIAWDKQRVLLVGDSLSVGLKSPLGNLIKQTGAAFDHVGRVGTRIDQWASTTKDDGKNLDSALASFKPTIVVVSLGTNDEAPRKGNKNYDVWKKQQAAFKALVAKFGDARLFWLGPPENSFMDPEFRKSLQRAVGPDAYFTPPADLKKGKDNLHPVPSAYKQWASAAMDWLKNRTQTSVAGLGALARLRRATQAIPLPRNMRNMVKVSYGFGQRPMLRVSNITPTLESITKPVPVIVTRQVMGLGATPMRVMVQPVVRRTRFEPVSFREKQSFPGQDWRPPSSNKFEPVSF
jgi:lysophospholipase L1-like esterase